MFFDKCLQFLAINSIIGVTAWLGIAEVQTDFFVDSGKLMDEFCSHKLNLEI